MLLGALFVLCIIGVILALIICKGLRKSLILLFIVGFAIGFMTEYFGIHRGLWAYSETSTFLFFEIPFEILILYATGLMFGGLFTLYLVKINKERDMKEFVEWLFFIMGVVMFVSFIFLGSPVLFSLGFFAVWGLSISKMRAVPLMLGLITFAIDIVIEGSLSAFTNYYEWTLDVPFAFMFFAIAFGGYMTAGKRGK